MRCCPNLKALDAMGAPQALPKALKAFANFTFKVSSCYVHSAWLAIDPFCNIESSACSCSSYMQSMLCAAQCW